MNSVSTTALNATLSHPTGKSDQNGSEPFLSGADIKARVEQLLPHIRERFVEIAAARQLPDDLAQKLRETGVFRVGVPRAVGGPEMTPRERLEVIELISSADPSVGWCAMIGSDSGYLAAKLPEDGARELYTSIDDVTGGLFRPSVNAVEVVGGYRVSGRFPFGSGTKHANVIGLGCFIADEQGKRKIGPDGKPEWRILMVPQSEISFLNTWDTMGLQGSGSHDYEVRDLFVPHNHSFSMNDDPLRSEVLYQHTSIFAGAFAGVPLGLARRVIDLAIEYIGEKIDRNATAEQGRPVLMRDVQRVKLTIARAEMILGSARAYVYESVDNIWRDLNETGDIAIAHRPAVGLSRVRASEAAYEVAKLILDMVATTAIYSKSPFGRLLNDSIVISQHVIVQNSTLEQYGDIILGNPPAHSWL